MRRNRMAVLWLALLCLLSCGCQADTAPARHAVERVDGPLCMGIVNYNEGTANGQERVRGVADALAESGRANITEVVTTLVDTPRAQGPGYRRGGRRRHQERSRGH